jgi:hemoglobin
MFTRIGGTDAVRVAVDRFYQAVVDDPVLNPYFVDVDMVRLKRHQALLLTQLLGGPAEYTGRGLAAAHERLGVTGAHFDLVGAHLTGTLAGLGAEPDVVAAVSAALSDVRDDIVTASGERGIG